MIVSDYHLSGGVTGIEAIGRLRDAFRIPAFLITSDPAAFELAQVGAEEVLSFIRSHGGSASPEGGGYWKASDGMRILGANATLTIYSLDKRGLLKRAAKHKEPWRDTYTVVEA